MKYYRLKNPRETFTKILDGTIDVALADSSSADYLIQQEFCQLEIVGTPFSKTDFGVAVPKEWPYLQDLNTHLLKLRANDKIQELLAIYYQQDTCRAKESDQSNDESHSLTIFGTSGLFFVYIGLTGLNFVCYVLCHCAKSPFKAIWLADDKHRKDSNGIESNIF